MHLQTLGYPAFIALPAPSDGAWYWRLNMAGSAEGGFRNIRVTEANTTGDRDSDNFIVGANGSSNTVSEFNGPDQTVGTWALVPISFGFDNLFRVSGTESPMVGNFRFLLEIEDAPGSGVYIPVDESDAVYSVVKAGADFIELGGPPPGGCFWTDMIGVTEDC